MGASFVPAKAKGTGGTRPGLVSQQYFADNKAVLTAWRGAQTGELDCFELLVGAHCVKGGHTVPPLEVFRMTKPPKPEGSAEVAGEVRRLFRWVVPNLPKAVPSDLRALMEHSANARTPSQIAAGMQRASAPPNEWERPKST
jgi:hypothetical protein